MVCDGVEGFASPAFPFPELMIVGREGGKNDEKKSDCLAMDTVATSEYSYELVVTI